MDLVYFLEAKVAIDLAKLSTVKFKSSGGQLYAEIHVLGDPEVVSLGGKDTNVLIQKMSLATTIKKSFGLNID